MVFSLYNFHKEKQGPKCYKIVKEDTLNYHKNFQDLKKGEVSYFSLINTKRIMKLYYKLLQTNLMTLVKSLNDIVKLHLIKMQSKH